MQLDKSNKASFLHKEFKIDIVIILTQLSPVKLILIRGITVKSSSCIIITITITRKVQAVIACFSH